MNQQQFHQRMWALILVEQHHKTDLAEQQARAQRAVTEKAELELAVFKEAIHRAGWPK
jgi:hypothetical protein